MYYDIEELCLRLISGWQYKDCKMKTERFVSLEKDMPCPPHVKWGLMAGPPFNTSALKCDIYTVIPDPADLLTLSTVKNFFPKAQPQPRFKTMENIYWRLKLRYACDIIPVAVIKMVPKLKRLGYRGWVLPSGDKVAFESVYLTCLGIRPDNFNVIQTVRHTILAERIEILGPYDPLFGGHFCLHTALVACLASGGCENKYMILDPTALQFGYRPSNKLVTWQSSSDYFNQFPGRVRPLSGNLEYDPEILKRSYASGNLGNYVDKLVKSVSKELELSKPCCKHCGETDKIKSSTLAPVQLHSCKQCSTVKYCDKFCQAADWSYHKTNCKSQQ